MDVFVSDVSGKKFPISEKVSGSLVRESLMKLIQQDQPKFSRASTLSLTELNSYREKYISSFLMAETEQLTNLERQVLDTMMNSDTISDKLQESDDINQSFGARVADKVASFGGSWRFIIMFSCFILVWILLNVIVFANKGFDPYPFILLNLILSCIAALQAPVIMMSQNRQEEKDRERAKNDYMVNLKSELEIRVLHEKMDHLIMHQQQELIEIQKVQIEMLKDILTNQKPLN
jgi:uncharacterized membrane protein